ncbi:MAG TPA: tetratricopeptide repeat protein [Thermoanaerobaculia bacterium]|nr:tetratricopeptide repeat protein [Thermoanaerobaculia bacterium]
MRVVQHGAEKKLAPWPLTLETSGLLSEGEKLYQAKRFEEAAAKYKAALEKDPESASAYLFYGDTFLIGANDPAAALAQYQKAIALDPTLPRPHFFASTAYVQLDRNADARDEIVRALTYHPSYEAVWRIALSSPELGHQARDAASIRAAAGVSGSEGTGRHRHFRRRE